LVPVSIYHSRIFHLTPVLAAFSCILAGCLYDTPRESEEQVWREACTRFAHDKHISGTARSAATYELTLVQRQVYYPSGRVWRELTNHSLCTRSSDPRSACKKTETTEPARYEFVSTQSSLTSDPPENQWLRVMVNSQTLYDHASSSILASGSSVSLSLGSSFVSTLMWAKDEGHFRTCGQHLSADEVL
jgi:hypothetical protein